MHRVGGGDVARDHLRVREAALELAHGFQRRVRVAVGDIQHERVRVGREQRLCALQVAAAHADRRRHAQPALTVAGRLRVARLLLEVAQRHHARNATLRVGQRQLLDAVTVQHLERVGRADARPAR